MPKSQFEEIEIQELIQKLVDNGYGELVNAMLLHEGKVFTKKGRANASALCRVLNIKNKQLHEMFAACREILGGNDEEELT